MSRFLPPLALLLAALILQPATVAARLDPALRWQETATPHFRILFSDGYADWAARTAALAEEIHQRLAPELLHTPTEPTTIVLADVSDLTNGMASTYPFNRIILYLAPPLEEPFSLTDHEDWLRLIITHEYAHILHLDNVEQGPATLQKIIGRVYFPNLFQPSWLIEGLATWEETRQTTGGRGRSAYSDMLLRMAILEDAFPTLAQAAVAPERWPEGEIPYLFGAAFYQHLAARYGDDLPGRLSEAYAGRSFPFLVDATALQEMRATYAEEWRAWQETLRRRYEEQRESVLRRGVTPLTLLTTDGGRNFAPSPSPGGRYLLWHSADADRTPRLLLRDLDNGAERVVTRHLVSPAETGGSWSADGSTFVFAQIERDPRDNLYSSLYLAGPDSPQVVPFPGTRHAARPDLNRTTGELAFVVRGAGTTRLVTRDDRSGEHRILAEDAGRLYFTPRWSPNGERLAVGARAADGRFTLLLLDPVGREVQQLPPWRGIIASPAWTPDGRFLLFSSDRDGIFNLYAWEPANDALFQVTDLLGGAFFPAPSIEGKDQLYLTSYSARGFDLAVMPLNPADWRPLRELADTGERGRATPAPIAAAPVAATPYMPSWRELRPRYWLPWFAADEDGTQIGLTTSGGDSLDRHLYAATALYGFSSRRPAWSLQYQYDGLFPTLTATVADEAILFSDYPSFGHDYWERRRHLDFDASFPSGGFWSSWALVPGLRLVDFDPLDPPGGQGGELVGGRLAWRFGNTVKPGRAISLEDGRQIEVAVEEYDRSLGDYRLARQSLDWHEFTLMPTGRHHVLATRIFVGRSDGDRLPQGAWQAGGDSFGDLPTSGLDTLALPLRGYRSNAFRGEHIALTSLEYRFPLREIDDGSDNGFFYLRRLHGALFAEGADLYDRGGPRLDRVHSAAGGEVRLDLDIGYLLPLTLRLVVARGFDDGGEGQVYISAWMRF